MYEIALLLGVVVIFGLIAIIAALLCYGFVLWILEELGLYGGYTTYITPAPTSRPPASVQSAFADSSWLDQFPPVPSKPAPTPKPVQSTIVDSSWLNQPSTSPVRPAQGPLDDRNGIDVGERLIQDAADVARMGPEYTQYGIDILDIKMRIDEKRGLLPAKSRPTPHGSRALPCSDEKIGWKPEVNKLGEIDLPGGNGPGSGFAFRWNNGG